MPKHYKKDNKTKKSTRATFDQWLDECGNDLSDMYDLLSCCGSNGPEITEKKLAKVPFDKPQDIDAYLQRHGYYKTCPVHGGIQYNPPTIHYLEWLQMQ